MSINSVLVLGAGNMGTAMAMGISNAVPVTVYNRTAARLDKFKGINNIRTTSKLNEALAEKPDMVLICVEGHAVGDVINEMKPLMEYDPVVASCAASVTLDQMEYLLQGKNRRLIRILPNIASTIGRGVNLIASKGISEAELEEVMKMLSTTGQTYPVEERLFMAAMAISSCGLAYALRYVRATAQAGVACGLSPELATQLCAGTLDGTAALLREGGHPEELIDRVTTPGGITIRGLMAMEEHGFTAATAAGILAAAK